MPSTTARRALEYATAPERLKLYAFVVVSAAGCTLGGFVAAIYDGTLMTAFGVVLAAAGGSLAAVGLVALAYTLLVDSRRRSPPSDVPPDA
jgi:hypothetical protein